MIDGRIAEEGEIITVDTKKGEVFITTRDGHHKARAPEVGVNNVVTACNHKEPHLGIFAVKTPKGLTGQSFRAACR